MRLWSCLILGLSLTVGGCFVSEEELLAAYDRDNDGYQPPQNGGKDCDNEDKSIHPGAAEVCGDDIDNNCDGVIDDDGDGAIEWYRDEDGDSFGIDAETVSACKRPSGYAETLGDCDDTDPLINPTVTDICDGIDNDCDGQQDEDRPPTEWFFDGDGDGFGAGDPIVACEAPTQTVAVSGDCDDGDAAVRPGQTEVVADGVDQDCDGVDDCYQDADLDGFGGVAVISGADLTCANPGEAATAVDCDDSEFGVNPQAAEIVADAVDQNCDAVDDCWADADGDGFGTPLVQIAGIDLTCGGYGESSNADDCNDGSAAIYLGAPETPGDGVDQDCDLRDDCFEDLDLDGYGSLAVILGQDLTCALSGESANSDDCDDGDPAIRPTAVETAVDGIDQDCDGADDCWEDIDGDGFGSTVRIVGLDMTCLNPGESLTDDDCNPALDSIYPGAPEIPVDGVDQDCDGADHCWLDADGDGHGIPTPIPGLDMTCSNPGESLVTDDCDDGNPAAWPNASEITANGVDEDCDGVDQCFFDEDGDGFGSDKEVPGVDLSCANANESLTGDDCDDLKDVINPGAAEICNDGTDNNCNGVADCAFAGDYDLESVYTVRFSSSTAVDNLTNAVNLGDTNSDGYDDLLVTGQAPIPGFGRGATYLVRGPHSGQVDLANADAIFTGLTPKSSLGYAASQMGDVNGDGNLDFVISAPNMFPGFCCADDYGRVYLFYGPSDATPSVSDAVAEYVGTTFDDGAGASVAFGRDITGDGNNRDLVIGAPHASSGGEVYIMVAPHFGTRSVNVAYATLRGDEFGDRAGIEVVGDVDLDGDGTEDVAVGAYLADGVGVDSGGVFVVRGPIAAGNLDLGAADAIVQGEGSGDLAGAMIARGGDINADGYQDLLVGAQANADLLGLEGAVYVLFGPVESGGLANADAKIMGFEPGGEGVGWHGTATGVGDVDEDGLDDIVVGASGSPAGGNNAGAAAGDAAGTRVNWVGDLNSDGFDDWVVTAMSNDALAINAGSVYLVNGLGF